MLCVFAVSHNLCTFCCVSRFTKSELVQTVLQYFDLNVSLSVSFILSNLCADGRSVCARTAITQMVITFQQSCLFGWKKKTIVKHKCEQYKQTHTFTHASTSRQRKTVNRCEYD